MATKLWTKDEVKYLKMLRERNVRIKTIARKLNRSESSVKQKIKRLGLNRYAFKTGMDRIIYGHTVTPEHVRIADRHGITLSGIKHRLAEGMSVEDAISTPPKNQRMTDEISDMDLVKIVGRIKYINKTEKEYPLPITKPIMKRLEQQGLSVDDIEPVEVEI